MRLIEIAGQRWMNIVDNRRHYIELIDQHLFSYKKDDNRIKVKNGPERIKRVSVAQLEKNHTPMERYNT